MKSSCTGIAIAAVSQFTSQGDAWTTSILSQTGTLYRAGACVRLLKGLGSMDDIVAELALYGPLAARAGGSHVAVRQVRLMRGSTVGDLAAQFSILPEEKGYVFVNAVLCDVPRLNASWGHALADGDHVGMFSLGYMWPYQYRDGAHTSEALREALRARGAMHHSYTTDERA